MDRLKDCELIRAFEAHYVHYIDIQVFDQGASPVHQVQVPPQVVDKTIELFWLLVVAEKIGSL